MKLFSVYKDPTVLFWGAEYPLVSPLPSDHPTKILRSVLKGLKEDERSLSEPDIVLIDQEQVSTIEVKYRSTNSVHKNHSRFPNYVGAVAMTFKNKNEVASSGYYELTRNLAFTKLLAEKLKRRFKLINLGMPQIRESATNFAMQLSDSSVFEIQTWPEVCRRIPHPRDSCFQEYLKQKGLE